MLAPVQRGSSPIGRGNRLKICQVRVRVPPSLPNKAVMISSHLKTIEDELKKAFNLIDISKAGTAPMFARLVNIERELWSIRQIVNSEKNKHS